MAGVMWSCHARDFQRPSIWICGSVKSDKYIRTAPPTRNEWEENLLMGHPRCGRWQAEAASRRVCVMADSLIDWGWPCESTQV